MRRTTIGRVAEFVPRDFDVPLGLETSEFVLEPLGPEHNELDYDAWTSSMEHIATTPGYPDGSWPREMTRREPRGPAATRRRLSHPEGVHVHGARSGQPRRDRVRLHLPAARQRPRRLRALLGAGEPRAAGHPALARRERVARIGLAIRQRPVRAARLGVLKQRVARIRLRRHSLTLARRIV